MIIRSPGMPWITSSFTLTHRAPGNPSYPKKLAFTLLRRQ